MHRIGLVMILAIGVCSTACGPRRPPKLAPEKQTTVEQLRNECEGGTLKSCRFAHDRDEDACRAAHDGKACWRAAQDYEQGLGVVADRDKATWGYAMACSNGVDKACTHGLHMSQGCWIGTPCGGRCLSRNEVCKPEAKD